MNWLTLSALTVLFFGVSHATGSDSVIISFDSDEALKKIGVSDGVTISRTPDDRLEVRITPFAEHGNQWPRIVFGPDYFAKPINLANHSRLETTLHHKSGGMSPLDVQ